MFYKENSPKWLRSASALTLVIALHLTAPAISSAAEKPFPDSRSADAAYEEARDLISKNDYHQALIKLKPFMTDPLKYPRPVSDYIVLLVWSGRTDEAIKEFESLPEGLAKPGYLQRNIAKAYYDRRDFKKAAALYQSALAGMPDDREAAKGLALSLAASGEHEKSISILSELLKKQPGDYDLRIVQARALFSAGRLLDSLAAFRRLAADSTAESENIFAERDKLLLGLSDSSKKAVVAQLVKSAASNPDLMSDYVLMLAVAGDYSKAISEFQASGIKAPFDILNWLAWSYFKTGSTASAKEIYSQVLASHPANKQAKTGMAYCLASENNTAAALEMLNSISPQSPMDVDLIYARAYVFERSGEFIRAINEYEKIIDATRDSSSARRLRLMATTDLGMNETALEQAGKELPDDIVIHQNIIGNSAVDRLKWAENEQAIKILSEQVKDPRNTRARFDYIAALVENRDMKQAVEVYESLASAGVNMPEWVLSYAAAAYLYLEQPYKALELYTKALRLDPASYKARLGLFHTLSDLRKWQPAEATLSSIEKDLAPAIMNGRPNFGKLHIAYERGWFLINQDRLREAEDHFRALYNDAPGNNEGRNGLAHTYYFRGWPRLAYEEFRIISNLEPEETGYRIGKATAMNAIDLKNEARAEAQELLRQDPKNKAVQNLVRDLKVQDMDEIMASFLISSEQGGFGDVKYYLSYTHPFTPYTKAYAFINHERSHDRDQTNNFRRIGAGASHIFNRYFSAMQQFSTNYDDAKNFGSLTAVTFTPDDFWTFTASYDSYTADVPFRARVTGISSKKYDFEITYRESELSDYRLMLTRYDFSDSNKRDMLNLGHSRQIFLKEDWKMRLFLDYYTSRNSMQNAEYFNPDSDWKLSITHMTEHIIRSIYKQSWIHRLYLTAGMYKQSGYSGKIDTGIRYEHDIAFSDTQSLLIGVSFGQNHYDGSPSNAYTFYLTYRGRI
ncbi:MAG: tetratricopeptide repeat protein [Nitrospiraceae bacterium]|nr:tetratricopeptide repeat protein [Nitrospiraceae bacterium]